MAGDVASMVQSSEHCPHLGLKQNRAIRFASPTPEHRCYVSGAAQSIPVEQATYCLCANYVSCPLYMGLTIPTTSEAATTPAGAARRTGTVAWLQALPARERTIYGALLGFTALIIGIYLVAALRLFSPPPPTNGSSTPTSVAVAAATSVVPPSPSATATATRTPLPTPTPRPVISRPSVFDRTPTATATPRGSAEGGLAPLAPPASEQPDGAAVRLYFMGQDGLLVPITQRISTQDTDSLIAAVVERLAQGTAAGSELSSNVPADTVVLDARLENGIAVLNLGGTPLDEAGLIELTLSLTELPGVFGVELLRNGAPITPLVDFVNANGVLARPITALNLDNPRGYTLLQNSSNPPYIYIPLFFENSAGQQVRITRLAPRTTEILATTVLEMLNGVGSTYPFLQSPIPPGTTLRNIVRAGDLVTLDLSREFAAAADQQAAVELLLLALGEHRDPNTGKPLMNRAVILIEGQPLGELWGDAFSGELLRPLPNED